MHHTQTTWESNSMTGVSARLTIIMSNLTADPQVGDQFAFSDKEGTTTIEVKATETGFAVEANSYTEEALR